MDLFALLKRIKSLITHPEQEWMSIKDDNSTVRDVALKFVFPLLVFGAITLFVRNAFLEFSLLANVLYAVHYLLSMFGSLYLSTLIVNELMANFGLEKDKTKVFILLAYSSTAFYISQAIVNLHNQFALLSLFSFYSIYLCWMGAEKYLNMDHKRKTGFVIISVLIVFFSFLLFQYLLSPIISLTYNINLSNY